MTNKYEKETNPILEGAGNLLETQIPARAIELFNQARADAIIRLPENLPETKRLSAETRIHFALLHHFLPYVAESEIIATQFESEEYAKFTEEITEFLGVDVGFVECPDGRVLLMALADPGVARSHRRLQGLYETRESTRNQKPVLKDPALATAINIGVKKRKRAGEEEPELVEFVGCHIHSGNTTHGCGACMEKLQNVGISPEVGMENGGIDLYFDELGDGFDAFENNAVIAGGKATTFDLVHDAYSQGFIVGLRNQYQNFDPTLPLRTNLINLARDGKILMTERLDPLLTDEIYSAAQEMGYPIALDMHDYTNIAKNAMQIGRIAKTITKWYEQQGYPWIPEIIQRGKSKKALRSLAYHAIRNVVYRTLGNITAGQHDREEHNELLVRTGPAGSNTICNATFTNYTPEGEITSRDVSDIKDLYRLLYNVYKNHQINFKKEGRVIIITGAYDELKYGGDEESAEEELEKVNNEILNNAAIIRNALSGGIRTGDLTVVAMRYNTTTRRYHIVSPLLSGLIKGKNIVTD